MAVNSVLTESLAFFQNEISEDGKLQILEIISQFFPQVFQNICQQVLSYCQEKNNFIASDENTDYILEQILKNDFLSANFIQLAMAFNYSEKLEQELIIKDYLALAGEIKNHRFFLISGLTGKHAVTPEQVEEIYDSLISANELFESTDLELSKHIYILMQFLSELTFLPALEEINNFKKKLQKKVEDFRKTREQISLIFQDHFQKLGLVEAEIISLNEKNFLESMTDNINDYEQQFQAVLKKQTGIIQKIEDLHLPLSKELIKEMGNYFPDYVQLIEINEAAGLNQLFPAKNNPLEMVSKEMRKNYMDFTGFENKWMKR
jgi:hypothetical protein